MIAAIAGEWFHMIAMIAAIAAIAEVFFTSAEREVKDSRRSGMYQSCNFLTRLGMQRL